MNKEMTMIKIIDLVNKEANSEKMPEKIKYKDTVYIYSNYYKDYVEKKSEIRIEADTGLLQNIELLKCLNNYVEVLEEDKDIELLDVALLSQSDNWLWCPSKDDFEKDIELNSYIISNIRENTLNFQRKLNEVIKEVNKLRKEDKEDEKNN